jgi:signal peptidase I
VCRHDYKAMSSFSTGFTLCRDGIAGGVPLRLRVRGTSMLPALWSGDTVSIHPVKLADVVAGQVVVFARNRHFVCHRVVRCIANGNHVRLVTRGDAQPEDDPPVEPEEFLGVVKAVHRAGAERSLHCERPLAAHGMAWLVRHSSGVRRLLDRLNAVRLRERLPAQPMAAARAASWGCA